MKLFSYIVTHDCGFSPNPFWVIVHLPTANQLSVEQQF